MIKNIVREKSEQRYFDLKMTTLMHTPGNEQGARAMQDSYRAEFNEITKLIYFAENYHVNINEAEEYVESLRRETDDGVMRYTE